MNRTLKVACMLGVTTLTISLSWLVLRPQPPTVTPPPSAQRPSTPAIPAASPSPDALPSNLPPTPAKPPDLFTGSFLTTLDEGRTLSSSNISGRMFNAEKNLRRQIILDEIGRETTEDSIRQLAASESSPEFVGFSGGAELVIGDICRGYQRKWLHDPRVAKVMKAAIEATSEERERYLRMILDDLGGYLDIVEADRNGETLSRETLNPFCRSSYPMILAELDRSRASIPLLVRWYELSAANARGQLVDDVNQGRIDPAMLEHSASSTNQPVIASAVATIAQLNPVDDGSPSDERYGQRWPFETVHNYEPTEYALALEGYPMLPTLQVQREYAVIAQFSTLSKRAKED